jgi:hypothetical protein
MLAVLENGQHEYAWRLGFEPCWPSALPQPNLAGACFFFADHHPQPAFQVRPVKAGSKTVGTGQFDKMTRWRPFGSPDPYFFGGFPYEYIETCTRLALINANTIAPGHGDILGDQSLSAAGRSFVSNSGK